VEVPLPAALRRHHGLAGGGVALVDVAGGRLKLRFLEPARAGRSTLTAAEEAALVRGGVATVSDDEMRVVQGRTAAEYEHLRATSLSAEEAARRLDVNASRVRQRLAERSLYGIKDGKAWILPAFQFRAEGEVPGLDAAVRRLKPGGRLVYCVCSLETEEGEGQVAAFLRRTPGVTLDQIAVGEGGSPEASLDDDGTLRILPHHLAGGMDGFYVARFRKG